ncbi:MAG TPA: hypothetical protein PLC80_16995 [Draconibacterium sp.]|nr:hypothetical protein [Draconibacterium sp.]
MSINCKSKNPLQRDGTSQEQRILKTLLPGYVAVDERNIEDLKDFVAKYANEIVYFDLNNAEDGNWYDFFNKTFDETSQFNSPHFSLFMAFLKIFKNAQDEMNKITKKHLDFYYRDVLHLVEKPAVPDQVYLIFELAKHISSHLLKKETEFKAGKDALGNNVFYETKEETALNKATVAGVKAVFTNKHDIFSTYLPYPKNDYRLYNSLVANSEDGVGGELTNDEKSWRTFGGIKFPNLNSDTDEAFIADRNLSEIGLAIASPTLFLAEGERIVTIYLNLPKDSILDDIYDEMLYDAFRLKFSGDEKWIEPIWEKSFSYGFGDVDPIIEKRILDFINAAKTAADIAGTEPQEGPVFDNPETGFGDQIRDYDIGMTVAARIISERNKLGTAGFTSLQQLYDVKYVGADKINDLVYSFGDPVHSTKIDKVNSRIIIKRTITRDQEAIVAYNEEILLDPIKTNWPVVKIILNPESENNPFIYKYLKDLKLKSADVVVDVREVKNLIIQNDQSVLDPGKPFQPFGNRPIVTSNFYVGSWEVFQKSINKLNVNLKWFGLPDDAKGFEDYYKNYYPKPVAQNNSSFKAKVSILDKKSWKVVTPVNSRLFADESGKLLADNVISFTNSDSQEDPPVTVLGNIKRDTELDMFSEYDQNSKKGFLKIALDGTDFGHKDYQLSYTKAVIAGINASEDYTGDLPNEPHTPQLENISIDYVSAVEINAENVDSVDFNNRVEQLFEIHPMGAGEIKTTNSDNFLFPQYNNEGELYIGVKDLVPPQNLSVLFQVSEGSSDPDLTPPPIKWSYLAGDKWEDFSDQNILSDSTKGLITTGVILFDIPSKASKNNNILKNGLHWLRAAAEKDSGGIPQLIEIKCQAAKVVFKDKNNDPDYLAVPLPEKTISKMVVADSAVKKIDQPFTSFGGRIQEESNEFYTRVSERLRHKNRAITIWDYEHIILQNFPSVYKVKCLNHTRYEGTATSISEAAPGNVSLVVVSNIRNKNAVDPLKPRTSLVTLEDIKTFIRAIQSPFISLHVYNPLFEEVRVKFNISFHTGFDKGIYSVKLNEALIKFLSPWAYATGSDIVFGGKIHKSVILNFVEEQEYVDYITCFQMFHIISGDPNNDPLKDVDEAIASTSASVLGSAAEHEIKVLETEGECDCEDNLVENIVIASADDCQCN